MKSLIIALFLLLIPLVSTSYNLDIPKPKLKIAVVYSYSLDDLLSESSMRENNYHIKSNLPNANIKSFFINSNQSSQQEINERVDLIDSKIQKYNPDYILVFGPIAFEHYQIKKLYFKNKGNSIFFNIQESFYHEMCSKYDLAKYDKIMFGSIQENDFDKIVKFLEKRNLNFNKIVFIRNKNLDHSFSEEAKNDLKKPDIDVKEVNTAAELEITLKELNKTPNTLIFYSVNSLKDYKNQRDLNDKEVVTIINKYNKNNFVVSVSKHLSQLGLEMSVLSFFDKSAEDLCNKLLFQMINREVISKRIVTLPSKFSVNIQRIEELGKINSFSDISNIDYVWR